MLEPLAGYLLLAQRLAGPAEAAGPTGAGSRAFAQGWNFGPGDDDTRPVQWIVERMAEVWGGDAPWRIEEDGPHEAMTLRLDSSLARHQLGWRPRLDLATAIDWIVEWYRAFYRGQPARKLTEEQIARYHELVVP